MKGLEREILDCAKTKIDAARTMRELGNAALANGRTQKAMRLSTEARDLCDIVVGWTNMATLLEEVGKRHD